MNIVKFKGTVKPSIEDRIVIVRFYETLQADGAEIQKMRKIYFLPQVCTTFIFSVPEEYTLGYMESPCFKVAVYKIKKEVEPTLAVLHKE